MKKIFLTVAFCAFLLLISSCGCEHEYGEWTTVSATCTEDGEMSRECTKCGESEKNVIASTAHVIVTEPEIKATCTSDGSSEGSHCAVCNAVITEKTKIPKTGHEIVVDKAVDPTCTATGKTKGAHCALCKTVIAKQNTVPMTGHKYGSAVITEKATATKSGTMKYKCTVCDHSYSEKYSLSKLSAETIYKNALEYVGEIVTYDKNGNVNGIGTGFFCSAEGKIITNYHVIKGAYSAKINIKGKEVPITSVLAYDKDIDLAIIIADGYRTSFAKISTDTQKEGQTVYTIGSSKGLTNTYSRGIITYAARNMNGVVYVQHDAAISSGNSGGPLINEFGEVIGINTMSHNDSQNLNFALSTSEISKLKLGTPMSMAEFYEKEGNAYRILADAICKVGKKGTDKTEYSLKIEDDTFILGYDHAKDEISVRYQNDTEGVTMYFDLILNSDQKNFAFDMYAASVNDVGSLRATGTGECATYKFAGELVANKTVNLTKGSQEYEAFLASGSMIISAELFALDYFLYQFGYDVGVFDLGFVSFIY